MNSRKKQHVFFVDDEPGIRRVVGDELRGLGCEVSCFGSGGECLAKLKDSDCNLLITDVKMPGMDGLTLLNKAKRIAPWISVMVITGYGDIPMSVRAMKSGAVDFVEKPLERDIFLQKVKAALDRDNFTDMIAGQALSKTEKRVLKLILEGNGNKQIAHKLGRSLRTAELHRSHIMHKLNVDNLVDLVKKTVAMDPGKTD